jgi:hypothetical protein
LQKSTFSVGRNDFNQSRNSRQQSDKASDNDSDIEPETGEDVENVDVELESSSSDEDNRENDEYVWFDDGLTNVNVISSRSTERLAQQRVPLFKGESCGANSDAIEESIDFNSVDKAFHFSTYSSLTR